ncbi:hypothetical protein [Pseudofrankia saprophytica]|uniref:hypothetical protein n=1 Tax=Pseudofrankia saprophytica TaxID=298655 RepID=UPI000234CD24|nr:hypothetical protein [Pseudofrankia saprophytica]
MSVPVFDSQIPATAARKVEFVSATSHSGGSELHPQGFGVDLAAYRQYVRALDEAGFDYTLNGYSANSADSFVVASASIESPA